ncbi:M23 family metallopeptidase [Anaeromyxobacter oryzisoli]|uniref:M23 family metallopeptidase n=1 Tax=Anaeromyxobacter oryzisoli TaxID=2925408 RepID=UPI001F56CE42|nr:M23 family metallopeptidase [Anaeromyxobacter sp. SG63]
MPLVVSPLACARRLDDLYLDALRANKGVGFFPVGASGMWHGGIHLQAPDDVTPIVAVADGTLVAYRLTSRWKRDKIGNQEIVYSNNFALVRHEQAWADGAKTVWFSLYMHLRPLEEYTGDQKERPPPVFAQKTYTVRRLPAGYGSGIPMFDGAAAPGTSVVTVVPERARIRVGALVTARNSAWKGYRWARWNGHEGYVKVTRQALRLVRRVASGEECSVARGTVPVTEGIPVLDGPVQRASVVDLLRPGSVLEVDAVPANAPLAKEGDFVRLRDGRYVQFSPSRLEVGNRVTARYDTVVTEEVPVRQGDVLGYPGAYGTSGRLLHFEIFSAESTAQSRTDGKGPDWTGWTVLRDAAAFEDKHVCSRGRLLGDLDGAGAGGVKDGVISAEEMVESARSPALKPRMEKLAAVHGTEWSLVVTNHWWERLRERLKDLYRDWVSHVESVQWWHQLPGDAGLPPADKVLHFHPVGFIATANTWLKQFTAADRDRIFAAVKEAESAGEANPFAAFNDDREYRNVIPTKYTRVVHIGLSWGVIQFTQDSGSLGDVLKEMHRIAPALFERVFGPNWAELLALTEPSGAHVDPVYTPYGHSGLTKWGKDGRPSSGDYRGSRVRPIPFTPGGPAEDLWTGSWKAAFYEAAKHDECKRAQRTIAYRNYFDDALKVCRDWNVRSDRGIAIALDRTIQQGSARGIFKAASLAAGGSATSFAPKTEREFLEHMADAFTSDPVLKKNVKDRINDLLNSPILNKEPYDPSSYATVIGQA